MEWTVAAMAELRRLWCETPLSTAAIGRELGGISKNCVVGKAHRMGLPARPSPIKRGDDLAPARRMGQRRRALPVGAALPAMPGDVPRQVVAPPAPPVPVPVHPLVRLGGGCRWPEGDPRKPGFRFCNAADVVPGKPYCAKHCAKAVGKPLVSAAAMAPRGWVA
jgi:GcrA cell cycle regulator